MVLTFFFFSYVVLDILGHGTFGQVAKCQDMISKEIVAVKVIKSKQAYLKQSVMEVSILDYLNNRVDKNDEHNLLRLKDRFMHKNHLCLVFELLSSNLYELIKRNQFRGLSTSLVRVFAQQLLESLKLLKDVGIIHCDLKPENILLKSIDSPVIKVIDFGSACHELQTVYTYIQSRFYRSPEVLLGLPYTTSIDMWSLGCIVAELFLGLPIFPGTSEYNQLSRIVDTLGSPPNWMVEMGKASSQFMEKYVDEYGRKHYVLKSREKYSAEYKTKEEPSKQYFPSTKLDEIIMNYPLPRTNMKQSEIDREIQNRASFLDFVKGLLNMNPFERWTPHQAAMHPFITESKFTAPFVPNLSSKSYRERTAQNHLYGTNGPSTSMATSVPSTVTAGTSGTSNSGTGSYAKQMNAITKQTISPPQQVTQLSAITKPNSSLISNTGPSQKQQLYYGTTAPIGSSLNSTAGPSNSMYGSSGGLGGNHLGGGVQSTQQQQQPQIKPPSMQQQPVYRSQQQQQQPQQQQQHQQQQTSSSSWSSRRPRASTIGNMAPIPPPIQRATALMNPAQPIRAQPSPAYIPPPELIDGGSAMHGGQLNPGRVRIGHSGLNQSTTASSMNYMGNSGNSSSSTSSGSNSNNNLNTRGGTISGNGPNNNNNNNSGNNSNPSNNNTNENGDVVRNLENSLMMMY